MLKSFLEKIPHSARKIRLRGAPRCVAFERECAPKKFGARVAALV
ncbi:MAG TPA: hypothetical protein VGM44_01770 [Polyangiaceae bacterium]|jgi:hypothetical protein